MRSYLRLLGSVSSYSTVNRLFCLLILGSFPLGAGAETILLQNGNRLEGELLKKSETHLFLDLGFDVLKVPAEAVAKIEEATTNPAAPVASATSAPESEEFQGLFTQSTDRQTRSVKENAEQLGEAVVQIRTPEEGRVVFVGIRRIKEVYG